MVKTQARNELSTAHEHARQFKQAAGDTEHLSDVAADIEMALDIWSNRNPMTVTPGELNKIHNMFRQAEHLGGDNHDLAAAEHHFKMALGV